MEDKFTEGPTLCRVERTYVDEELIRVTLEPVGFEDIVELAALGEVTEFVRVMSLVPLAPLSVWTEQVQL